MILLRRLIFPILILFAAAAGPAEAAVTMVFWSHEFGNEFPHAFVTLRGVPDAGGPPVDTNVGFTARHLSPKLLFGTVDGRLDVARPGYMRRSDAQFAIVLTDVQYAAVLALARAWSDSRYNLNSRNCVHFVQEAGRIAGLRGLDHPQLMKKPRSYLKAVAAANAGRVIVLALPGHAYLDTLPPLPPQQPAAPVRQGGGSARPPRGSDLHPPAD